MPIGIGMPTDSGAGSSGASQGFQPQQSSPGGSGGGNFGGGSGGSSGVDWSSFAQQIPQEYRNDPSQFVAAFNENRKYRDFYEKEYTPWRSQYSDNDWAEWAQWRQQRGQQGQGQQWQGQEGQQSSQVDWDDPTAAEKAYGMLQRELAESRQKQQLHEARFEQTAQQYLELLHLMRQADALEREELLNHLGRNGFQPRVNAQAVVQYAMDHNISDLKEAAHRMQQDQVAQRATASPQASRKEWRGYTKKLQDAGGLHRVVRAQHPGLPAY